MNSFRKRTSTKKPIPGTKTSLHNSQVIASCGNPSLDHILGGGIPIGSLILIEEDKFVTYAKVLTKYFLAEGIFSSQSIFFGCLDDEPSDLIKKLPKPIHDPKAIDDFKKQHRENPLGNPAEQSRSSSIGIGSGDDMRIAWRYNELPKVNSEQSIANIGHLFNLTEQIDEETIKNADIHLWNYSSESTATSTEENSVFENELYFDFLKKLDLTLKCDKFSMVNATDSEEDKSILRVCISSLGSPLWYSENFHRDFIKFLTILKSIIRNSSAVCFLTIPMYLLRILDDTLIPRIRNLVDFSFELESFAGSDREANPIFKEYNGIFHVRKINALNSLAAFKPETTDLAFKLRRKKFAIEKLHLPPEIKETETSADEIVPSLSCASATKNLLEF